MTKKTMIIDYILNMVVLFTIFNLTLQSKEHLCCDGGKWWFTIQLLTGLLFCRSLISLILVFILGGINNERSRNDLDELDRIKEILGDKK